MSPSTSRWDISPKYHPLHRHITLSSHPRQSIQVLSSHRCICIRDYLHIWYSDISTFLSDFPGRRPHGCAVVFVFKIVYLVHEVVFLVFPRYRSLRFPGAPPTWVVSGSQAGKGGSDSRSRFCVVKSLLVCFEKGEIGDKGWSQYLFSSCGGSITRLRSQDLTESTMVLIKWVWATHS